jgi:hypothetical protein
LPSRDSLTNSSPIHANYASDSLNQRPQQAPVTRQTKVLHNLFAVEELFCRRIFLAQITC